jgi:hypothetical protein
MPADTVGWCLTKRYVCVSVLNPARNCGAFFQLRLGEAAMEKFVDQQNPVFLRKQLAETPNYLIFGHL